MNTTYYGFDKSAKFSTKNVRFTSNGAYVVNHENHHSGFSFMDFLKTVLFTGIGGIIVYNLVILVNSGVIK